MKTTILALLVPMCIFMSCAAKDVRDVTYPPLHIYGTAAEGISERAKLPMSDVYDASNSIVKGCFEAYLKFAPGEFTVTDLNGRTWHLAPDGKAVMDGGPSTFSEEGIYRIRINCNEDTWSKVRIDNVEFRAMFGNGQTVYGEYSGLGRWTFGDISLSAGDGETKYYIFDITSGSPEELSVLCSTSDRNLSDPDSYKSAAYFVRAMGDNDYGALQDSKNGTAGAFRFISADRGKADIRLQLNKGQSRYIHYVEVTPPGPPAAFMGDSITENWRKESTGHPLFFSSNGYLNFGISGQTTAQMLARFEKEIVENAPQCAVICGGTNDIAGNGGNVTNEQILKNISDMAAMAEKANIKVILCSILPTNHYWWAASVNPVERIADMNTRIKGLCNAKGWPYVDYFTPMADNVSQGILAEYSDDRIHPNKAGYTVMENIVKPIIDATIK